MKTILLFLLMAVSAHAQTSRPTYDMVQMDFTSQFVSDTATSGMDVALSFSGDTVKYTFTSHTSTQESQVVVLDYNGGLLSAGDTLISTNVSLTMDNVTFNLLCPTNAIISEEDDGTIILTTEWCILPLNGQSVYCHIVFEQNQ